MRSTIRSTVHYTVPYSTVLRRPRGEAAGLPCGGWRRRKSRQRGQGQRGPKQLAGGERRPLKQSAMATSSFRFWAADRRSCRRHLFPGAAPPPFSASTALCCESAFLFPSPSALIAPVLAAWSLIRSFNGLRCVQYCIHLFLPSSTPYSLLRIAFRRSHRPPLHPHQMARKHCALTEQPRG